MSTTKRILEFIKKRKEVSDVEVRSTSSESGYVCSSASEDGLTENEKELNIPPLVIATFKRILKKFSNGVTATTFYKEYYKECGYDMDPLPWGIRTPIEVFYSLPSIFLIIPPDKAESDHMLYDVFDCPKEVVEKLNNLKLVSTADKDLNSNSQVDEKVVIEVYKVLHLNEKVTITNFAELYRKLTGKEVTPQHFGFNTFAQFFMQLRRQIAINFDCYTMTLNEPRFKVWISQCIRSKLLTTAKYFVDFPSDVALPGEKLKAIEIPEEFIAVENENNDAKWMKVQITAGDNFSKMYLQLKGYESSYAYFSGKFQQFFASRNSKSCVPKQFLVKGFVCAVRPGGDYYWYRAMVRKVHSDDEVTVNLVDFGYSEKVKSNLLRFLPREFIDLEVQAIQVSLHNIQPVNNETNAAFLLEYSEPEIWLDCLFYPKTNNRHSVVLRHISGKECVNINDALVEKQLALPV